MSKTPRVDAYMAANYSDAVFGHHLADFARQLESENAELMDGLREILAVHANDNVRPKAFYIARALLAKVNA